MEKIRILILVPCVLFFSLNSMGQTTVSGRVTNADNGEPIPKVSILIKGTNRGASTDENGNYSIRMLQGENMLVFSSVGFQPKEEQVEGNLLNVKLNPTETQRLDEVLVLGFGTQIKRDLTGNIAQVKGKDIENTPVTNLNQALQGRAAGVFVESGNGKVGQDVKVLIRGVGSISASTSPLYVIDGVPITTDSYLGSAIADIDFDDIESFDILKDASATAIYGARAANGVVLITTKKGRAGKTVFRVNGQFGLNKPTHLRDFLDTRQYIDLVREAAINSDNIDGIDPLDPDQYEDSWLEFAEDRLTRYSGWSDWRKVETNTDWQKKAFNDKSKFGKVDISASGGTDRTKFYLSLGYTNQQGILIGNNIRRISSRINLENTVSEKFRLGLNLSLSQTASDKVKDDNQFSTPMQLVAQVPVTPFKDKDGIIYTTPTTLYANPYLDYTEGKYKGLTYRNMGNVYGQYDFTKSLFFRSEFGVDIRDQNDDRFYGSRTSSGMGTNGFGQSVWYRTMTYTTNNYFSFNKIFQGNHNIEAVLGTSFQEYTSEFARVEGEQFPVDDLQKLASAGLITGGTSSGSKSAFLSYFARANYKFRDKYLFSVSGRIDGSSVFGKDRRYGVFPAISGGWIISKEGFLQDNSTLSFLKLRASWGLTGNAEGFGDFASRGLWDGSSYNSTGALVSSQMANPDLGWEKSNQVDLGLDFGLLNNRITGEIDYYNRNTNNLIYNVPVVGNTGFTVKTTNIGAMNNRGVEFVVNSNNVIKPGFRWSSSINVSRNKNKIVRLDGDQKLIPGTELTSLIVGESIGVFYGPKFAGADPENGDALYYLPDGKETTNDYDMAGRFVIGNPNPKVIAGLNNTLSFHGFDVSFLFQGVFGNQTFNDAGPYMSASFAWFDNQTADQLNRWQHPGDITQVPQLRLGYDNGTGNSSRYVENADYVRLKNVTVTYNLPKSVIRNLKIQNLSVYFAGVNLLTFTSYTGWDPELNTDANFLAGDNKNQGLDFYAAPQVKNYSIGLNIEF